MARKWALINMRKTGNTAWRKEQNYIYKVLKEANPEDEILMEYPVKSTRCKVCRVIAVLDIANVTKRKAYRLQGEYHTVSKDLAQAKALKAKGWTVMDLLVEGGKVYGIRKY